MLVGVGVFVLVLVGVGVFVLVLVGVGVFVFVLVDVGVLVGVAVGGSLTITDPFCAEPEIDEPFRLKNVSAGSAAKLRCAVRVVSLIGTQSVTP